MDSTPAHANDMPNESVVERDRRIAWEAEGIAKARASAAAGRLIDAEAIDAWIDSLGSGHERPPPRSGP